MVAKSHKRQDKELDRGQIRSRSPAVHFKDLGFDSKIEKHGQFKNDLTRVFKRITLAV